MAAPSWESYNLEDAFPDEMAAVAQALADAGQQLAEPLIVAGQAVQAFGVFLVGFVDPLAAALNAILNEAEAFINNLMESGIFFTYHLPQGLTEVDLFTNTEPEERGYKLTQRPPRTITESLEEAGIHVDMGNEYIFDFDGDGQPDLSIPVIEGVEGELEFAAGAQETLSELENALRKFASVEQWVTDVANSVFDASDPQSPRFIEVGPVDAELVSTFGQSARIGAVAIIAVAPSFLEFIDLIQDILRVLFNIDLRVPAQQDASDFPNSGDGRMPDWISMKIRDLPHMAELERVALSLIGLIRPALDILAFIEAFGEMLERKGLQIQELAERLADLLEALGEALTKTGFFILKIDVTGGNQAFHDAMINSANKPALGVDEVVGGVVMLAGGEDATVEALLGLF